jgi:hypothetical protein
MTAASQRHRRVAMGVGFSFSAKLGCTNLRLDIPEVHDGGPPLFRRPHEIIHGDVPALRYLVRIRIVEFQDSGFFASGGASVRPRTARFSAERYSIACLQMPL